ncbi:MAG: hypothetical protein K0R53_457 [Burkholderiales bacterium]|nr:hypothetical protein [Burkholderiales bacterium]
MRIGEKLLEFPNRAAYDRLAAAQRRRRILALHHYGVTKRACIPQTTRNPAVGPPLANRDPEGGGQVIHRPLVEATQHRGGIGHDPARQRCERVSAVIQQPAQFGFPDRKNKIRPLLLQPGFQVVAKTFRRGGIEEPDCRDMPRQCGRAVRTLAAQNDPESGPSQGADDRHCLAVIPQHQDRFSSHMPGSWCGSIAGLLQIQYAPHPVWAIPPSGLFTTVREVRAF